MKGKLPKDADIDLGLAVSALSLRYGQSKTQEEIAAYCGCSKAAIQHIENRAMRKVRKALYYDRDPELKELLETYFKK